VLVVVAVAVFVPSAQFEGAVYNIEPYMLRILKANAPPAMPKMAMAVSRSFAFFIVSIFLDVKR